MAMKGHTFNEIKRKVRSCVIEEGLSPDSCVKRIEEEYELTDDDKFEIMEMATSIGKKNEQEDEE